MRLSHDRGSRAVIKHDDQEEPGFRSRRVHRGGSLRSTERVGQKPQDCAGDVRASKRRDARQGHQSPAYEPPGRPGGHKSERGQSRQVHRRHVAPAKYRLTGHTYRGDMPKMFAGVHHDRPDILGPRNAARSPYRWTGHTWGDLSIGPYRLTGHPRRVLCTYDRPNITINRTPGRSPGWSGRYMRSYRRTGHTPGECT